MAKKRNPKKRNQPSGGCRLTLQNVFEIIISIYRDRSGDNQPITRATRFRDDIGFDPIAIAGLANKVINRIEASGCSVTGINDGQVAAQSATFGAMANVIFEHMS